MPSNAVEGTAIPIVSQKKLITILANEIYRAGLERDAEVSQGVLEQTEADGSPQEERDPEAGAPALRA